MDLWNLKVYDAKLKEAIVLPVVSSGSQYPAKFPCPQEPPWKEPPAKPPPGLEPQVTQVLMTHHEEMLEQEGMPRAVTQRGHRRPRERAGCPIHEGQDVKAAPPMPRPMMFANVREAEAFVREEQERVGEVQGQAAAANS